MRWLLPIPAILLLLLLGPLANIVTGAAELGGDWRTASRAPVGLAPDPATAPEAIVQVYAARAFGWRGAFGVHSWIAVKPSGAPRYTVLEVSGWHAQRGLPALQASNRTPDSRWFGSAPMLLAELRGPGVDAIIERISRAAEAYPYANSYHLWPGPNSNSFTAYIARQVPELRLDLPPTAIGKDFLNGSGFVDKAPSGTGYQVSLFGLAGVLMARVEGLEIDILGLTIGIDPFDLAVKLPGLGRFALAGRGAGNGTAALMPAGDALGVGPSRWRGAAGHIMVR